MVEKVITSPENVVDFARYQASRNTAGRAQAISPRACCHCGAALLEGESEDECSSAGFNAAMPARRGPPRKLYAD